MFSIHPFRAAICIMILITNLDYSYKFDLICIGLITFFEKLLQLQIKYIVLVHF